MVCGERIEGWSVFSIKPTAGDPDSLGGMTSLEKPDPLSYRP